MITSIQLSQEIFAIGMLAALKSRLKHRRKHILRWLQLYGDKALSLGSYFWQSNYDWVIDCRDKPVEDLIKSQLQSEKKNLQTNVLLILNCV